MIRVWRGLPLPLFGLIEELAYADIFVSAVEGSSRAPEILEGLDHAQGFLRHELSQRIDLRAFPRLRFHWDTTPERADNIERLITSFRTETKPMVEEPDHTDDE